MGLSIRFAKGKTYPILTCDRCGKPITDLEGGIAAFDWHRDGEEFAPVSIYHKGECDSGLQLSDELEHFLPQLVWNLNLGKKIKNGNTNILIMKIDREDML